MPKILIWEANELLPQEEAISALDLRFKEAGDHAKRL